MSMAWRTRKYSRLMTMLVVPYPLLEILKGFVLFSPPAVPQMRMKNIARDWQPLTPMKFNILKVYPLFTVTCIAILTRSQ